MAQVIGAKSLGVVLITDKYNHWDAPTLAMSDKHHMDKWLLNVAPHWVEIPLAIVYQTRS